MDVISVGSSSSSSLCTHVNKHLVFFSFKTGKSTSSYTIQCKRNRLHIATDNARFNLQTCVRASVVDNGKLASACHVLDEMPLSDTLPWNSLIQTHLSRIDCKQALLTFERMLVLGVRPDRHTIPRILTASRLLRDFGLGKQVQGQALKLGLFFDSYIFTALMELYGCLDGSDAARWLFDKSPCSLKNSAVAWTMLAKLYVTEDKPQLAVDLFNVMVESGAADVDAVAIATAIGASGLVKSLREGRNAHRVARALGLEFDSLVSNSLLKMYVDCGSLKDAQKVFDGMPSRDVISWTEMLCAYVKRGGFNEGLKLFREMVSVKGIRPDAHAISSILPACARIAASINGREIHCYLLRSGIKLNLTVLNAVMDMYVKSGNLDYASKVFARMKEKDVISWTMMIMGHSLHGYGDIGVEMFCEMEKSSVEIDQTLYVAVLYACCIAHLVDDGKFYFNLIEVPKIAHYALMVALLARSGRFGEARAFIENRKLARHGEVLRSLLDGCRTHKNVSLGKRVIEQLLDLEPLNAENYVLLSNWYAHSLKWDMVDKLKETIKDMGLKPRKAYSWIEFRNKVHVFGTGDTSHPRSEKIYGELRSLMTKLVEQGLRPSTDFSLHDVDEERECVQIGHSEMLAVSFGLISTQGGTKIRVSKNLRMCCSCHDSFRLISNFIDREIIVKDVTCFHHFRNGLCSCREF